MGAKFGKYDRRPAVREKPYTIHPIWRGIGCFMMLIIPVLAYAGASLLVESGTLQQYLYLPPELTQPIFVPALGYVPNLYANLVLAVVLALIGFAVVVILYALVYRIIRPKGWDLLDAPPIRSQPRRKR